MYLLFVEALGTQLKLFVLGLHGFAQFLKYLRENKSQSNLIRHVYCSITDTAELVIRGFPYFTHKQAFIGVGQDYCMCRKSCINHFMFMHGLKNKIAQLRDQILSFLEEKFIESATVLKKLNGWIIA